MELVKGLPVTDFCDRNHLTPRRRLELFVGVCQAVQHAHQKGIIDRDIKPSNVLVTMHDTTPVVKVIDFGVAKALGQELTDKTLFTGFAQMIGTPMYMSPEQAGQSGLDVDTRSDIYSLGVLLYELLTGTTPLTREQFQQAAYDEIRRIIREEDPPRPSTRLTELGRPGDRTRPGDPTRPRDRTRPGAATLPSSLASVSASRDTEPAKLTKQFRGEVDWIVMRALEKDRNRRYETANAFAADVQRYLNDETVQACPPTATYRLRKFARRNKRAMVTVSVLVVAVLLVVGTAGWALRDRAARVATTAAKAEQVLGESEHLYRQRKLPEAAQLAHNALALVDGGGGGPAPERRAREWLKDLEMVARLEEIHPRAVGDWNTKLAEYPQAFREYGIDIEALPPEEAAARIAARPIRVDLAVALDRWVAYSWVPSAGLEGEKGAALRARLARIARLADPDPLRNRLRDLSADGNTEPGAAVARELAASADLAATPIATLMLIGDQLEEPIVFYTRVQQQYPSDFGIALGLGRIEASVARFPDEGGTPEDLDGAIRFLTAAVAIRPTSASAHRELGLALAGKGLVDEAVAEFREDARLKPEGAPESRLDVANALMRKKDRQQEALATYRELVRADPNSWEFHDNFGQALRALGRTDEAIAEFREVIRIAPNNYFDYNLLGLALDDKGSRDEAIAAYREAVRLSPIRWLFRFNLGLALEKKGLTDEAIAAFREAARLHPKDAGVHLNLGQALRQAKRFDEAIVAYLEAVRLDPKDVNAHRGLGHALFNKRRWDDAIAAYRTAVRLNPDDAEFHADLGNAFLQKGSLDEALGAFREAVRLQPDGFRGRLLLARALLRQRRADEAVAEFREAVRLRKDSPEGYDGLGLALSEKGSVDEAVVAWREVIRLQPKNSAACYRTGDAYARLGRWKEAAGAFDRGLELGPTTHDGWYVAPALHLGAGDVEGYRRLCRGMLERFGNTDQPNIAERTAKACLLLPDALSAADFERVQKLADRAVTGTEKNGYYRFFVLTKGLADYRAGRHAEAVKWLERFAPSASGNEFDATGFAALAMAQHRLGRAEEAQAALAKAKAIVAKMPDPARGPPFGADWNDWLHAQVLCREAESLLKNN